MNRKKYLLAFFTIILLFSFFILVSCSPPAEDPVDEPKATEKTEDGTLINNGSFRFSTSSNPEAFLLENVVNWNSRDGSFSTTDNKVKSGVIDLSQEVFEKGKHVFSFTSTADPTKNYELKDYPGIAPSTAKDKDGNYVDTKALIISLADIDKKKGSMYYDLATSSSLAKDSFYKLSIDVYTDLFNATEKNGAAIELTERLYSQILSIDTKKEWRTYTFYIQTDKYRSESFNLKLWLGHGPEYLGDESSANPYLAAGSVLFDNILIERISPEEAIDHPIKENCLNGGYYIEKKNEAEVTYELNEKGNIRYLDLSVVDPGFNAISDNSIYSSSTTIHLYSAKKGIPTQYSFHVGEKDISSENKTPFPDYSTTASNKFPIGVFDMSKLYLHDDENPDKPIDSYKKIDSTFTAPSDFESFMKKDDDGKWAYNLGRESVDSTALLVWHPKGKISGGGYTSKNKITIEKDLYYELSVWVYIWIPEIDEPEDKDGNEKDVENYNKYMDFYRNDTLARAQFKISGVSIEESDNLSVYSKEQWGSWEKLTIKIKGNSLSKREITPEFWYGNGLWGDDTLVPGGCFFDDLTIVVKDKVENEEEYHELSILNDGDYKGFGLIGNDVESFISLEESEKVKVWEYTREDEKTLGEEAKNKAFAGISSGNSEFINSTIENEFANVEGLQNIPYGPGTMKVKYENTPDTPTDVLILNHANNYTASTISFYISENENDEDLKDLMLVNPNSFYRFSFWVNTINIPSNLGAEIKLEQINYKDKDSNTALATFSSINVGEWTEYIVYIKGAETKEHRLGFSIQLGKGDINTDTGRAKGAVFFTAPTWQKISYDEHKESASSTSDTKKTATAKDDSSSTTSEISNGFFKNFDSNAYENASNFDENGNLIKAVQPSNWQYSEAVSGLPAVSSFKIDNKRLTWEKMDYATHYYIYMNEYEEKDETDNKKTIKIDNVLIDILGPGHKAIKYDDDDNKKVVYSPERNGKYYIRAVYVDNDKKISAEEEIVIYSPKTSVLTFTAETGYVEDFPEKIADDQNMLLADYGIINYKKYEKFDDPKNTSAGMYGDAKIGEYVSPYSDNLLMIYSKAHTVMEYKYSSTYSITKGSYYMITAWIKTEEGAKASLTLEDNSSTVVQTSHPEHGEYIGFVNIDTNGKWVQYRMIINAGYVDGRVTLELALGNKYAKKKEISFTDSDEIEVSKGLSKGRVFFDDINIKKLDGISDFNLKAYGLEDIDGIEESEYKFKELELYSLNEYFDATKSPLINDFSLVIVDYRVDSFDSSTESSDDYLGRKPGAYTHNQPAGSTPYEKPSGEETPKILYGVYNEKSLNDEVIGMIVGEDVMSIDSVTDFLATNNGNGSNFLMMANIEANGQSYEITSGFDLLEDRYYRISFGAKLLAAEGKKAQFRFIPGKDPDNITILEISRQEFDEYEFFIYIAEGNGTISSNKIAFHLGTNDGIGQAEDGTDIKDFFRGILIIDDVCIEEYKMEKTEEEFKVMVEDKKAYKFDAPKEAEVDTNEGEEEEKAEKRKMDSQLWLLVSTIVIAAVLVIALIVIGIRKFKARVEKGQKIIVKSKVPTQIEEVKKSKASKRKEEVDDSDFDS